MIWFIIIQTILGICLAITIRFVILNIINCIDKYGFRRDELIDKTYRWFFAFSITLILILFTAICVIANSANKEIKALNARVELLEKNK